MMDKLDQSTQTDALGSKGALDVKERLLLTTSPSLRLVCLFASIKASSFLDFTPTGRRLSIALFWGADSLLTANAATPGLLGSPHPPLPLLGS